MNGIRVLGCSDAAFANKYDLKSQLGRIILFADDENYAILVLFKIYKPRGGTRSALSEKVIAFADLFYDALALRSQVEQAINRAVLIHLLTDSKSSFNIFSKRSRESETRVMLEVYAASEANQSKEIFNISLFAHSKILQINISSRIYKRSSRVIADRSTCSEM